MHLCYCKYFCIEYRHTFLHTFLSNKPYRRIVNIIVNNFLHTSHAINFLLYIYSAPNFRDELKKIVTDLRSKFCKQQPNVKNANKTATKTFNKTNIINNDDKYIKAVQIGDIKAAGVNRDLLDLEEKEKFLNSHKNIDQIEMVDMPFKE